MPSRRSHDHGSKRQRQLVNSLRSLKDSICHRGQPGDNLDAATPADPMCTLPIDYAFAAVHAQMHGEET